MNFRQWLETNIFVQKQKTQSSNISKILGFDKPLIKFSEGTFATLYQHPKKRNLLIKITAHKSDVLNLVKAQRLSSSNVIKVFDWEDGQKIKEIPSLNSLAIIVEKVSGSPVEYHTGDLYDLSLGNFDLASDWLNAGGHKVQQKILESYGKNNDMEHGKLSSLFKTLFQLQKFYSIDLSDFQDNILDDGKRYVIVDMGF